ncbi:MAG: phosphoadenylyl-sulfate reductase [Bacteroidales bacterium]|nr:phosphoadenylyl-sulfate reductase [Bacteroidales bacterium]
MNAEQIKALNKRFEGKTAFESLTYFLTTFKREIAFASSLGAEDQVLTHLIVSIDPSTKIFTLDTGRLFPETYDLIERTNSRYKIKMDVYFPSTEKVEKMVKEKGINLFYESVENRKLCCHLRKIEPLHRAIKGYGLWITGLRKSQSITRNNNKLVELDENNHGRVKINPLINWTEDDIWDYIKENNIPYNKLHDKGFPSIGCQPCTRAVEPGDDVRAGRWWWEMPEHKECGLHQR